MKIRKNQSAGPVSIVTARKLFLTFNPHGMIPCYAIYVSESRRALSLDLGHI